MKTYMVKLDKWASPTAIKAVDEADARAKALDRYPVCDCGCEQWTHVESVKEYIPHEQTIT